MPAGDTASDFVGMLERAFREASREGVRLTASASDLEAENLAPEPASDDYERKDALDAFEADPVEARHPGEPQAQSGLSYFLDGVQATQEICRVGTVPVVATTVAASIARREDRRLRRFAVNGVPQVARALLLPARADDPEARALFEALKRCGMPVLDEAMELQADAPAMLVDSTRYDPEVDPADYAGLKDRAYVRARALREGLETALLRRWPEAAQEAAPGNGWIAVDGQLSLDIGRAVGLIKSSGRPFFRGDEARMLLDLAPGCRTTAFVPPWRSERVRGGRTEEERASWYIRLWPPPEGSDATGGLLRVEAVIPSTSSAKQTEIFDEISRWLLAERVPLARPDPRWASMIYPIHYVEKTLKPLLGDGRRNRSRIERLITELRGG